LILWKAIEKASTMAGQEYDLYSPYQHPWMGLNVFIAFWILSHLTRRVVKNFKWSKKLRDGFKALSEDKKRNVVTYVLQLIATVLALGAQLYGGKDLLFQNMDWTTPARLDALNFSVSLIAILYIWELCYREKIGTPLLIHHLVTLLLIQLITATLFDTHVVLYYRFALLLGFHATTEQASFVALFAYRLGIWETRQSRLFYVATAQCFFLKTAVTIISVVFYCTSLDDIDGAWGWFWKIGFLPLMTCLYGSQLYAAQILFTLGGRCRKINGDDEEGVKTQQDKKLVGKEMTEKDIATSRKKARKRANRLLSRFENQISWSFSTSSNSGTERTSSFADFVVGDPDENSSVTIACANVGKSEPSAGNVTDDTSGASGLSETSSDAEEGKLMEQDDEDLEAEINFGSFPIPEEPSTFDTLRAWLEIPDEESDDEDEEFEC